jgi:hypothetical protein
MRYKIVETPTDANGDDVSRRAAEMARELGALMAPAGAMLYLSEFALACVVNGSTNRAGFEEYVGEGVPDALWRELEAMSGAKEETDLADIVGQDESDRREMVAAVALGCVAAGPGSKELLAQRLGAPLSEREWAELKEEVGRKLPRLKKTWRQMRDHGMVAIPDSLFGVVVDDHSDSSGS